ncbi:hypothetical protein GCM10010967_14850 [Dyadobacter beijingensis]|uniref:Bacterial Pleckstrin homology domain-containing protein n=1 Tax=Dyadobacter beijingensis TaxID=365489 RepID=A0ABQ2HL06_9BACT|nr:PH domain-containing protein [Dyadobacter beijingensis]GGM84086.1 hypothetical protein GCM10010967_14850 [Dyadobacter beijingensis]
MKYSASLDKSTQIITIAITALFAGIGIFELLTFSGDARIGAYFSVGILSAVYWAAYIYRPTGYTLTDDELIIHRPISNVVYPRRFESTRVIDKESLKYTIRTFGVGAFWGYFGKFYNTALGKMTWYVTRRDQLILIKMTDGKTILVSPDDLNGFAKALENTPSTIS